MRKIVDFLIGLGSEKMRKRSLKSHQNGAQDDPNRAQKERQDENGKSVKTNNTPWLQPGFYLRGGSKIEGKIDKNRFEN